MKFHPSFFALLLGAIASSPISAAPLPQPGLADLADLSLGATSGVRARIDDAREIRGDRAPDLAPGFRRFLVRADVGAVLAAPQSIPGEIRYLVDLPETDRGRAPRIEGSDVLLFLGPEDRPGEFRLAHKYGQQVWTAGRESDVRRLLQDRGALRGLGTERAEITSAFHVPGTLQGESESQIFVRSSEGRPLSLVVLRRPGAEPRVTVATGDIIDPDAPPPERGSLAALALSCSLPDELPTGVASDADQEAALRADFAAAKAALGTCDRNF